MAEHPAPRADPLPADYPQFLADVKARIAAARTRAALAVNSELVRLYWEIGREILDREQREGWGWRQFPLKIADQQTGEEQEFFIDLLF